MKKKKEATPADLSIRPLTKAESKKLRQECNTTNEKLKKWWETLSPSERASELSKASGFSESFGSFSCNSGPTIESLKAIVKDPKDFDEFTRAVDMEVLLHSLDDGKEIPIEDLLLFLHYAENAKGVISERARKNASNKKTPKSQVELNVEIDRLTRKKAYISGADIISYLEDGDIIISDPVSGIYKWQDKTDKWQDITRKAIETRISRSRKKNGTSKYKFTPRKKA